MIDLIWLPPRDSNPDMLILNQHSAMRRPGDGSLNGSARINPELDCMPWFVLRSRLKLIAQ